MITRAVSWFIAPPRADHAHQPAVAPGGEPGSPTAEPPGARFAPPGGEPRPSPADSSFASSGEPGWAPAAPAASQFAPPRSAHPSSSGSVFVPPAGGAPSAAAGPSARGRTREITSAAVVGRAGEAEPVAAALALALARGARSRAATVIVLGPPAPEPPGPPAGGTIAARRLAERLAAHGLAGRPRGRIAWVRLPADGDPARVRRAALVGAPAVIAVTVPRTAALEPLLCEQALLLLVTADPEGPLARLAADAHRSSPVLIARPLARGPARSLARGGVRPARAIRELLASAGLQGDTT